MTFFKDARFKLDGYCFQCGRRYLSIPNDEDLCPKCRANEKREFQWYNWYGQNEVFLNPPDLSAIFDSGFCDRCGSSLFDVKELTTLGWVKERRCIKCGRRVWK